MVCGPEFGVQVRGRPKEVCRIAGLTVGWLHPPMGHGHRAQPTGVVLGVRGQGLGLPGPYGPGLWEEAKHPSMHFQLTVYSVGIAGIVAELCHTPALPGLPEAINDHSW